MQQTALAAAWCIAADPRTRPASLAPGEAPPEELDLSSLVEALEASRGSWAEEHQKLFGLLPPKDCPPYETEYCPQTFSVYRSQQMADVAGFYRAFGLTPSREKPERADHVSLELEFMSWLIAKEHHARQDDGPEATERVETCRDAQRKFFADHLSWWLPAYANALHARIERARGSSDSAPAAITFHHELATTLARFVAAERAFLGVPPPTQLVEPSQPVPPQEEGCGACAFGPVQGGGPEEP